MNILTEPLQAALSICGKTYPIETDFRIWLKFSGIWESRSFAADKLSSILVLCLGEDNCKELFADADKYATETIGAMLEFYIGKRRKSSKENEKKSNVHNSKRIFSFAEDAEYIYSAFMQQYGIDLIDVPYMHWHKFMALFRGLSEDCRLMKIISYRSVNISEIQDKTRKAFYKKMQEMHALIDNRTDEERESDFAYELSRMF